MKANKKYNAYEVVASLSRKADLQIKNGLIQQLVGGKSRGDVGIKSRGKIDFLTKYCGYRHIQVGSFIK